MAKIQLTKARTILRNRRWRFFSVVFILANTVAISIILLGPAESDNGLIIETIIASAAAIGVIFISMEFLDATVAVNLFCDHCSKHIPYDVPWKCGYCSEEQQTRSSAWWGLLGHCLKCKSEAKAFICPHCQKVNYLDLDQDGSHPASISLNSAPEGVLPATLDLKRQAHLERKTELEHEIEITQLAAQLEALKASPIFKKEVAKKESIVERFSSFETHTMGVHMFAKQKRDEYEERFKDDSDLLEQANESLQAFVEDQLISTPEEPK